MRDFLWRYSLTYLASYFLYNPLSWATEIVGWHPPKLISEKVLSYSLATDFSDGSLYLFLEEKTKNTKELILLKPNGERKTIVEIRDQRFPLKPTIAVCRNEIWLSWQESFGKYSTISWVFSPDGGETFSQIERLKKEKSLLLPKLICDGQGDFYLAYQEEGDSQMNLILRFGRKGQFLKEISLANIVKKENRGMFLPFFVALEKGAHLFFQLRKETNLTDEIFWLQIKGPDSFSRPIPLTENDYHDYAPFALPLGQNFRLVWQSNENKLWSIMYRNELGEVRKINDSLYDAQSPSLLLIDKKSEVITWLDFRKSKAQVFAKFIGREAHLPVSQEHQVTNLDLVSSPQLINTKDGGFLFYLSKTQLFSQKVDMETGKIMIRSPTHPEGKVISSRRGEFFIEILDEISGIDSAGYLVSEKIVQEIPIFNLKSSIKKIVVENLPKGKSYFHFQYRDKAGNLSPVKSYPLWVDLDLPAQVEILSASHLPNSISAKKEVEFTFESTDDTGILGYYYFLSTNPQSRFSFFTKNPVIKISKLKPGIYYLGLQAEDLAGNLSYPRIISFQIVPEKPPELEIYFKNSLNELHMEVLSKDKKIEKLKYEWLKSLQESRAKVMEITPQKIENSLFVFNLPREKDILRFSFMFYDKTFSQKYYYFLTHDFIKAREKPNLENNISDKVEIVLPAISLQKNKNYIEFVFSVEPIYQPYLKGFSFSLNEELKESEINSLTGREIFYNLPQGQNWLEVKPIFSNKKLKGGKIVYPFTVGEELKIQKKFFSYFVLIFFFILGLFLLTNKKVVFFYLSYFKK